MQHPVFSQKKFLFFLIGRAYYIQNCEAIGKTVHIYEWCVNTIDYDFFCDSDSGENVMLELCHDEFDG